MQVCRWIIIILIGIFLQSCCSIQRCQEYELGKFRFCQGDYRRAFHDLLPVAASGNAQAQYAIGYMYYYGYGVVRNTDCGMFWMTRAAGQGDCSATKALELISMGPPACIGTYPGPCSMSRPRHERLLIAEDDPAYELDPYAHHHPAACSHTRFGPAIVDHPDNPYPHARDCDLHIEHHSVYDHPNSGTSPCSSMDPHLDPFASEVRPVGPPYTGHRIKLHPVPVQKHRLPYKIHTEEVTPVLSLKKHKISKCKEIAKSDLPKKLCLKPASEQTGIGQYTLQLFGGFALAHVQGFQKELKLQHSTQIWRTQNRGRDWYILTCGNYKVAKDAKLDLEHLPNRVRNLEPWVRKTTSLNGIG